MATNKPGTPIARNKKPNRAASAVSTPCELRDNAGDVTAAKASTMAANGMRNQPDNPKLVMCSNMPRTQPGSWRAQSLAAASIANIEAMTTYSVTAVAASAGSDGRSILAGGGGATARVQRSRFFSALCDSRSSAPRPRAGAAPFISANSSGSRSGPFTAYLPIGTPRW